MANENLALSISIQAPKGCSLAYYCAWPQTVVQSRHSSGHSRHPSDQSRHSSGQSWRFLSKAEFDAWPAELKLTITGDLGAYILVAYKHKQIFNQAQLTELGLQIYGSSLVLGKVLQSLHKLQIDIADFKTSLSAWLPNSGLELGSLSSWRPGSSLSAWLPEALFSKSCSSSLALGPKATEVAAYSKRVSDLVSRVTRLEAELARVEGINEL